MIIILLQFASIVHCLSDWRGSRLKICLQFLGSITRSRTYYRLISNSKGFNSPHAMLISQNKSQGILTAFQQSPYKPARQSISQTPIKTPLFHIEYTPTHINHGALKKAFVQQSNANLYANFLRQVRQKIYKEIQIKEIKALQQLMIQKTWLKHMKIQKRRQFKTLAETIIGERKNKESGKKVVQEKKYWYY